MLDILALEVPFSTTSGDDLIALCTYIVADAAVAQTVRTASDIGNNQFGIFFAERLIENASFSVLSPLPRNKLPLFSSQSQANRRTVGLVVSK